MFPAHAGVILPRFMFVGLVPNVPRACGGDPMAQEFKPAYP